MRKGAWLSGAGSQAKLERHVESWSCKRGISIKLDHGKIVNGIAATEDEVEDFVEAILSAGNLDGGMGIETQVDQARDLSQIEAPKPLVIWNVEED